MARWFKLRKGDEREERSGVNGRHGRHDVEEDLSEDDLSDADAELDDEPSDEVPEEDPRGVDSRSRGNDRPAANPGADPGSRERDRVRPTSRRGSLTGARAVREAKDLLIELTGHECESVSGLSRTDDGGWAVTLEALELERVPRTTDILATYVVELDENGDLLKYERTSRYYRNQAGGSE